MKELIERNYQAVVNRGLINLGTTDNEFLDKLGEEMIEAETALFNQDKLNLNEEIGDCIVVCLNWLIHRNVDIENLLTDIAIKNENRANNGKSI